MHSHANSPSLHDRSLSATLLAVWVLLSCLTATVHAQGRPSTLTPSRDSAPPGATLRIAVDPAFANRQPAGSHLLLRPTRRGGGDVELRITEWAGDSIRASIPRDAGVDAGAARLVLIDRGGRVIADSGNQWFRVAAAREVPSEGRTAGGAGSATQARGGAAASRLPGAVGADVAGGDRLDHSAATTVPSVHVRPDADPRSGRAVSSKAGDWSTPGVAVRAREAEVEGQDSGRRRAPPFLRNQKLAGMDYRHFAVESVAECHTACAIESQCRSWTYRPARRNDTFDNGDDGPACFLKSGIPQREYARGYVSGIKPPPPAAAAGVPSPPVVTR